VLAVINAAAGSVSQHGPTTGYLFAFLGIVIVYVISKRFILLSAIRETEQIVHRIRIRIADKVLRSDLTALERIGRSNIFAGAGKETQTISQAAFLLTNAAEALAMLVFATIYLAWLSIPAFLIGTAFTGFAVAIHFRKLRHINRELRSSIEQENRCLESLTDVLSGFKEAKVNTPRAEDLYRYFSAQSARAAQSKISAQNEMAGHFTLTQVLFYLLIATMVFVVPIFSAPFSEVVVKTATSVLFMIGSITTLVSSVPILAQANAAADTIRAIEDQLDRAFRPAPPGREPLLGFEEISFHDVIFQHRDAHDNPSFAIGPLSLTFRAGEMVFITGGNGSGKSTLIKLLVGLYRPTAGVIRVDGKVVDEQTLDGYRNLFAVVFSDYHLFARLYGMMDATQARIDALLQRLEIEDKTRVVNGEFDTLDLSGGQRKRVALLVALLEDRPIIVLDEWAADQDPVFRRKFYQEMLPELKRQGKTIIAITHDDQYFGTADRQLRMEYGQVATDSRSAGHA
jgi:putative ATP-binding cassette transporter